jgi:hypothetical protein
MRQRSKCFTLTTAVRPTSAKGSITTPIGTRRATFFSKSSRTTWSDSIAKVGVDPTREDRAFVEMLPRMVNALAGAGPGHAFRPR